MTCHARALGAQRRPDICLGGLGPIFHHLAVQLYASLAAHTPRSARTHHPPTVPVSPRLLLCGSLSPSLPLSLSCPLSLSRSFSLALLPLRPTLSLSLSLSLSHKGVFGTFGGSLSPPGFEPSSTGQKRCGIPTELRRVVIVPTFPIPPCVSSPVRHIAFRMGVCSAACRGTAQRLRIPCPPA